jgi:hypothetical protein
MVMRSDIVAMRERLARRLTVAVTLVGILMLAGNGRAQVYQLRHWSGQGVAPVYEGFDVNPDGSFNMWFGYMNRNFEEELDVPSGPDNKFEPGPADRGQPTHFDTRRHKDVFRVVVPKDFGETEKLVWTVTVRGKPESIVATLNRVWLIDRKFTTRGGNSQRINSNTPPVVTVQPTTLNAAQDGPAKLSVAATDDGYPMRQGKSVGMTVEWEKYRGPGKVTFSQVKQPLVDGKADVAANFSEPGSYVLIAVVDDGSGESAGNFGYHCCWTNVQVTVNVTGGTSGGRQQ